MNIFILDYDIEKSAQYHCDAHVIKMILESVQILSTVNHFFGHEGCYKPTHVNHPCTKWARESYENYLYLMDLTAALQREWRFRYNHPYSKSHASIVKAEDMIIPPELPEIPMTPFAQAMPDKYKDKDAVVAYRNYYMGDKRHLAKWKKRGQPDWWE